MDAALIASAEGGVPVMLFAGNRGCFQINLVRFDTPRLMGQCRTC
jgi:putative heme degradation protein